MKIDALYLKSLFSTLLVYIIIVGLLVIFVAEAGIAGVLLIFSIVVLLVVYFYGGFRRQIRGKGFRS